MKFHTLPLREEKFFSIVGECVFCFGEVFSTIHFLLNSIFLSNSAISSHNNAFRKVYATHKRHNFHFHFYRDSMALMLLIYKTRDHVHNIFSASYFPQA